MPVNWNGDAFLKYLNREMARRIDAATTEVQSHAKELLSVEGTGQRKRRVRSKKTGKLRKSKKLVYNANPSKPGEPPHVQTGRLRGGVARERVGMVGRVGTNVKYGRSLEQGTKKMAKRPWLLRALLERRAAIGRIMRKPLTGI